jgi:hypothetical protein
MEPLSAASAFATIVGLICSFKSERRAISGDEYKAFIEWLQTKRHGKVIQYLEMNSRLIEGIRRFLEEDNKIILQKLETINNVTTKIASGIEGLAEIAREIRPNQELSHQCLNIVRELNDSSGSRFLEGTDGLHSIFQVIDGDQRTIKCDEQRFIEDDLRTLVELGLLRLDYTKQGSRIFYLTREATNLLQMGR